MKPAVIHQYVKPSNILVSKTLMVKICDLGVSRLRTMHTNTCRSTVKCVEGTPVSIGNMDENPMFFDMRGIRTVDVKGASTVTVKTTGHDKTHFTVILVCMGDGTKLKPALAFKRKTMPKEKLPAGVIVYIQEKGWVDEAVLTKWLNDLWFSQSGAMLNRKSILVWDMFRVNLVETVNKRAKMALNRSPN